jgi:hypothetical protein
LPPTELSWRTWNQYAIDEEPYPAILPVDPETRARQLERLERVKAYATMGEVMEVFKSH